MRAAMARYSGLIPVNPSLRDKVAYEAFMNMERPQVTIDGHTFTYEGTKGRMVSGKDSLEKDKV